MKRAKYFAGVTQNKTFQELKEEMGSEYYTTKLFAGIFMSSLLQKPSVNLLLTIPV